MSALVSPNVPVLNMKTRMQLVFGVFYLNYVEPLQGNAKTFITSPKSCCVNNNKQSDPAHSCKKM